MAGYKLSFAVISRLWKVLFAASIHLFNRLFRRSTSSTKPAVTPSPGPKPDTSHAPDLEQGSFPQQATEDMAASKKRGGQRRPSVKTGGEPAMTNHLSRPGNRQHEKENIAPEKRTDGSSNYTLAGATALGTSTSAGGSDVQANTKEPRYPKSDETSQDLSDVTSGKTAAMAAVVPVEGQHELNKPGSHIPDGTQASDSATSTSNGRDTDSKVNVAASALQRLDLDSISRVDQKLDKDSAAIAAAAVPVVMSGTQPKPTVAMKPLAPLVTPPSQVLPGLIEPDTEEGKIEREYHLGFMREALGMGELALSINETPVGCVLVYKGRTIAKGMNATNITRNGTRHAEFMALSALLSHHPDTDAKDELTLDESVWGDVDPSDGHIFPYGQKLHPSPRVSRSIVSDCVLYVTVEPCVMCASLLRQLGIKKVYFGAVNDKFGGTGGVFRIHVNSKPVPKPLDDKPYQNGYGSQDVERISRGRATPLPREEDDGDGGNVERGFPAEGGYLRDEAVSLLRRFYVQENGRAPQPRKKEGRAARLFAMENAVNGGSSSEMSDGLAIAEIPVGESISTDKKTLQNGNKESSTSAA